MKNKFTGIIFLVFFIIFILSFSIEVLSEDSLISIEEFKKLSADKKELYLKDIIPKFIYELKLIYYITLTDKPKYLFLYWENAIKKTETLQDEKTSIKRSITLITIYIFLDKLTYIERNISIINSENNNSEEIEFIKSVYYLYYSFENTENYIAASKKISNFLINNKMIASYFMNYTSLDKIQIIITANFNQFIEIFTDRFLMEKLISIRSEELKKELVEKIIIKKPSFIVNQIQTLLMSGSNDFNSFLINLITLNNKLFSKSEKDKIKNQFQYLLNFNTSEIIHKYIYLYFSKVETDYYINNFSVFYKNESNLIKANLIFYLTQIENPEIYKLLFNIYKNEKDKWMLARIFEQINENTKDKLPSSMALEFLKQFQTINEDKFIILKTRFLFYFNSKDKTYKDIRMLALSSIEKNFIKDIDDIFTKYLSLEKDFEIFKNAIQITINYNKLIILKNLTYLITKEPIVTVEYINNYDYYNFLCNVLSFGIDQSNYRLVLKYFFPLLSDILQKKQIFDVNKVTELLYKLDGLFSIISYSYLPYHNNTAELRKFLFQYSYVLNLNSTVNILLSLESNNNSIKEYIDFIEKNKPRENIVKGLFYISSKTIEFNEKIINIIEQLIINNKSYNPFLTNLDDKISKNYNVISLIYDFFNKLSLFDQIYSVNIIFKDPEPECHDIIYKILKLLLQKNDERKNKNEVFPYLLNFEKIRPIIYKLFVDNEIEKSKKIEILDLFAFPQFADAAYNISGLLSNKDKIDILYSIKIIETIGKMRNPENFLFVKDFVEKNYDIKEIQLKFAQSSSICMSHELIPYLIKLTEYPDMEVKEAAYIALGYLPVSDSLPYIYKDYLQNKNPEKLYRFYERSNEELKRYYLDFLQNKLSKEKFLEIIINGIYPYKFYKFDEIILEKIFNLRNDSFYNYLVLSSIKKIPPSQFENIALLTPFLFISNESINTLKYLKLVCRLKIYELARFAILSDNINVVDIFFSLSNTFNNINFINIFDFLEKYKGKDGLIKIIPVISKYSKAIGVKNSVDFFIRVYDVFESNSILFSIYPLSLDLEDCSRILEKDYQLLPIVLKLAANEENIYKFFVNFIFEKSFNFSLEMINLTLRYVRGYIPEPFDQHIKTIIEKENREEIKQTLLYYILSNINEEKILEKDIIDLIISSISIENQNTLWQLSKTCKNFILFSNIIENNLNNLRINESDIIVNLLKSNSNINSRNLLYLLFINNTSSFFNYLNTTNSKIDNRELLIKIIQKLDTFDSLSFRIIVKSLISNKNNKIIDQYQNEYNVENLIYELIKKSNNTLDKKDYNLALNFLIQNTNKNTKNILSYEFTIYSIMISNISESEKILYINKFIEKSRVNEEEFLRILSHIRNEEKLDSKLIMDLFTMLPFIKSFNNLSSITSQYLSIIDITKISDDYLKIILPKLDCKIVSDYIVNKNFGENELKRFIKILPGIIIYKPEYISFLKESEIINYYFELKDNSLLYFLIENSLIDIGKIFLYAYSNSLKLLLVNDILNGQRLISLSAVNLKIIIEFFSKINYKNLKSKDITDKFTFLIELFLFNYDRYDFFEKFSIIKNLIFAMPIYIDNNSNKLDLSKYDENKLKDFYGLILLSYYFLDDNKIILLINDYSLPVYESFENIIKNKTDYINQLIYDKELDYNNNFDQFNFEIFIENILELIIKLYPDQEILEKYIILNIKDNEYLSMVFWKIVIKYKIPGLIYLFDKYYGGIKWEKIRDSYLSSFK